MFKIENKVPYLHLVEYNTAHCRLKRQMQAKLIEANERLSVQVVNKKSFSKRGSNFLQISKKRSASLKITVYQLLYFESQLCFCGTSKTQLNHKQAIPTQVCCARILQA